MRESEERELSITVNNNVQETLAQSEGFTVPQSDIPKHQSLYWWIQIVIYMILILLGQSIAVILGRLYYNKGGKSVWMTTLLQSVGFPVLLPLYYIFPEKNTQENNTSKTLSQLFKVAFIYILLGLFGTGASMMYSVGLKYMQVSTFSLLCASQLGFNALFSFFINSQRLTPYIMNSLLLLTISSALLVLQPESSPPKGVSKAKYVIGLLCAVGNSAGYGLLLSVTQFTFQRILKNQSFKATLDMIMYLSAVASSAAIVGLLASGEWKTLKSEMGCFEQGKFSYMMTIIWTALSWQVYTIGSLGLLIKVSSLFSNVVSTLGLPIVPVLAVIIFHDTMDGIKVVAILLSVWGFVSYAYQEYLDLYDGETRNPVTRLTTCVCGASKNKTDNSRIYMYIIIFGYILRYCQN